MTINKIEFSGKKVVRPDGTMGWTEELTITRPRPPLAEKQKPTIRIILEKLLGKKD